MDMRREVGYFMGIKDMYNYFKDYDKLAREKYGTYHDDLFYGGKNYNASRTKVKRSDCECICCGAHFTRLYYGVMEGDHESNCDFANGWVNSEYAKNLGESPLSHDEVNDLIYKSKGNLYSLTVTRINDNYLKAYQNKDITNKKITNKIIVKTSQIAGGSFIALMLLNLLLFHSFMFSAILISVELVLAFGFLWIFQETYREKEYGVYRNMNNKLCSNGEIVDKYYLSVNNEQVVVDIAKEYNDAISLGKVNNINCIMSNVTAENEKWKQYSNNMINNYTNRINNDYVKGNIEVVERYKENPVLNGLPLSDSSKAKDIVLNADKIISLKNYLSAGDLTFVRSLIERFNVMDGERENLNGFDLAKLDNCRSEFYVNYNKLLVKIGAGDDLTDEEVNNFMNVVDSCAVVLSIVSPKLVEGRMDKLRVSNMFLEDKYNLVRL